jgi:fatty acid desaturase
MQQEKLVAANLPLFSINRCENAGPQAFRADDHPIEIDDTVRQFAKVRAELKGKDGTSYVIFRASLSPDYAFVWRRIACGYAVLAALFSTLLFAERSSFALGAMLCIPLALTMGYTLHFLSLFQHAAAHNGLSPDSSRNDRLSNVFLGVLLGSEIKAYRSVHMQHHTWHGSNKDPENAYVAPPDWRFFLGWLSGMLTVKKIISKPRIESNTEPQHRAGHSRQPLSGLAVSLCVHAAIFAIAVYFHHYMLALAWFLAVGIIFPMLADLRVILEHRSDTADRGVDYRVQPHGQFTRMFKGGFFTRTFGGAGFDRHLLHHWEPAIPFERLQDLESFLREAGLSDFMDTRTMTYRQAFAEIVRS